MCEHCSSDPHWQGARQMQQRQRTGHSTVLSRHVWFHRTQRRGCDGKPADCQKESQDRILAPENSPSFRMDEISRTVIFDIRILKGIAH